uniref:Trichome birefringence-like C-terminal domain-containing protein n=2 Tax=Aegilops tauschii subsp. strangulata TaxID=200361 RepID=A0A453KEJ4_AEGTS
QLALHRPAASLRPGGHQAAPAPPPGAGLPRLHQQAPLRRGPPLPGHHARLRHHPPRAHHVRRGRAHHRGALHRRLPLPGRRHLQRLRPPPHQAAPAHLRPRPRPLGLRQRIPPPLPGERVQLPHQAAHLPRQRPQRRFMAVLAMAQPNNCSLPTFDARRFMERMRGKRLMFVGDSLNRNQFYSLVCMVQSILSKGRKKVVKRGSNTIFHAKEYRATLEFYWAPFLVESNSDDPNIHSIEHRIIRPERIEGHAQYWRGVDYLIFDTYIWWMNTADIKVRRPDSRSWSEHDEVPRIEAYGRVLKTWSDWLNENIDPARTSVFFMTISPIHIRR